MVDYSVCIMNSLCVNQMSSVKNGEVGEWLKPHAWKVCMR